MTRKILHIILFLLIPFVSIAQDKLTKNEIYSMVCYSEENRNKILENFDSTVVIIIDSLKVLKIDTIGIFSLTSHTPILDSKINHCEQSLWTAYIQWVKNGITYHEKLKENCKYKPSVIGKSAMISFYKDNRLTINENKIMPAVTDVYSNEKGNYTIKTVITNSRFAYKIYCELNGNSTIKTFEDYAITNEVDNLLYIENKNSIINTWWELIKNQITKIEKE